MEKEVQEAQREAKQQCRVVKAESAQTHTAEAGSVEQRRKGSISAVHFIDGDRVF